MKTRIKSRMTRWSLRLKEVILRAAAAVLPMHSVRRAHLRASYNLRAEVCGWFRDDSFDPNDVYNGHDFAWSRRPIPTEVADRLLAEHDAAVEKHKGWDFRDILERNIKHKH